MSRISRFFLGFIFGWLLLLATCVWIDYTFEEGKSVMHTQALLVITGCVMAALNGIACIVEFLENTGD